MTAIVSFLDPTRLPQSVTLQSSLNELLDSFQAYGVGGEHTSVPNRGGFFGGNMFNGTDYSGTGKTVANYAFAVSGDIHYYFPPYSGHAGDGPTSHTVWGTVDSITLGGGLDKEGHVTDALITFTFDTPLQGDVSEGRGNDVHDVIWGLMNGHVDGDAKDSAGTVSHGGLIHALGDNGLDISHITLASLVGHTAPTEAELLLAA